jgi:hypothetical protein
MFLAIRVKEIKVHRILIFSRILNFFRAKSGLGD